MYRIKKYRKKNSNKTPATSLTQSENLCACFEEWAKVKEKEIRIKKINKQQTNWYMLVIQEQSEAVK